ncbi:glycosyltransferase family 2 protein [Acinetobacter bereziniae]|uniref:glycosyltransferase family 2 protein n=1 Tax=Acinetobacter bereziniae TaxID=106648 RepID=UPI001ABD3C52|nr:glycosyltransferase [Acinetobacter bereziniae]MBO3655749.1 glycosyltransferase [Acinetobacter bereziniae]
MMKLSVIIPIYKVEKYIIECLESVCCQLPESVEVILVNDGTTDDSMNLARKYILGKYIELEKQFIFIEQDNQGLSSARNKGISVSNGEYIAFLDSDDKLKENYFEKILNILTRHSVDLIQFSAMRFDDNGNYSSFLGKQNMRGEVELNQQVLKSIFESSSWFAWLRVYKKVLFDDYNNLFPVGVNYEDAFLVPKLILKSDNIFYLDDILIFYRLNLNGITFSNSKKNIDDCQFVLEHMIDNIEKNQLYIPASFNMFVYLLEISLFSEGVGGAKVRSHDIKRKLKEINVYRNSLSFKQKCIYFFGVYYVLIKKNYHWLKKLC